MSSKISISHPNTPFSYNGLLTSNQYQKLIADARQRSMQYGLNASSDSQIEHLIDTVRLTKDNRILMNAAKPVLQQLSEQWGIQQSDSLLILANADATVLCVEGDPEYERQQELQDLIPGVCWSEEMRGTNAVGTALATAQPMLINSGEHFLERLDNYSCSSVLLNDPQGQICGALSLARKGPIAASKDGLLLLAMTASYIDRRLFISSQSRDITLAFHLNRHYLDSPWQGLLSVSLEGLIVAANDSACELLNQPRHVLLGQHCETILGDRSPVLKHLTKGLAGRLNTGKGSFFYKILQVPQSENISAERAALPAKKSPKSGVEQWAGDNPEFSKQLLLAQRGFNNELPILLLGETGTGKEVIAQALHNSSNRAGQPFIAVNCAAIPEGLIESELFGYSDGAFTGAKRGGMLGRLQQAHGGTLFLDEVGDMPLALQARLLRVLQERKVAPLGAGVERELDIGLICATHRDLNHLVSQQQFREDLFYRINGLALTLPALRHRKDLPELCQKLLQQLSDQPLQLTPDLTELLSRYCWPGNIRQLQMLLRTLVALREPGQWLLGIDDLPASLAEQLQVSTSSANGHCIRSNEDELIRSALAKQQGNVTAAARELGISRATLYRKLKQLEV